MHYVREEDLERAVDAVIELVGTAVNWEGLRIDLSGSWGRSQYRAALLGILAQLGPDNESILGCGIVGMMMVALPRDGEKDIGTGVWPPDGGKRLYRRIKEKADAAAT